MLIEKTETSIIVRDISQFSVRDIVNSGQLFRYYYNKEGDCIIFSQDKNCILKDKKDYVIIETEYVDYFEKYFDFETDYTLVKEALKPHDIDKAIAYGGGIRMLKQDKIETIFSFIISQNNNIPRIKSIIDRLSRTLGRECDGYYAFPTVEALASQDQDFYKSMGLGYRSQYIVKTARAILDGFSVDIDGMDTDTARAHFMSLVGIGPKVADCILLFGYGRMDVFPVDTWVKKIYSDLEDTKEKDVKKMAKALRKRFGAFSGYAQQYLFFYYRDNYGKMED